MLRRMLEAMLSADKRSTRSLLESSEQGGGNQHLSLSSMTGGRQAGNDYDTIHTPPPADSFSNGESEPSTGDTGDSMRLAGATRINQYELIRELGRGGMGSVWLARDTKLGRRVAIKFLLVHKPKLAERFQIEARATARCSHENIVVIHDVNEYRTMPYMVLEYLKGQPLNKLITDERMPPSKAVQLMVPVVRALVCAHEHQIIHRDLKPANIFMTENGVVKVLDFGIAKVLFGDSPAEEITHSTTSTNLPLSNNLELTNRGALIGTLPYMSPEQWGVDGIDHRTDVWAVGIMLYRMIIGRHPLAPLRGEQLVATSVLEQPMPSAHSAGVDMPLGLADVIDSCLRKHKDERMPSAAKLLTALERYLPGRRPTEIETEDCPYTGLNAFQEADANRFFGRARETGTILARLHGAALMAVVGPSGAGKSSIIRAGVIPGLEQSGEDWESMIIRPGLHPMAALANIVTPMVSTDATSLSQQVAENQDTLKRLYREPGYLGNVLRGRSRAQTKKILLFVDQFEELFTMTPEPSEQLAFTACLTAMADDPLSPLRVILSIRSDFLDRVAEDRHFMGELSQNLMFISAPDRNGLRDAIVRPAEMVRYRFESAAMIEHMLGTLETTPGCLPLLQFAAAKLWDARDTERRVLTQASYDAMGGVAGALATHADAVLARLPPTDQGLVRSLFLHLVTPERTRAIKSRNELRELVGESEDVDALIGDLVDARLLVVQQSKRTGGTVEIVHESLIKSWPTFAHWLDESQEDSLFLEQLRGAAKQWDGRERSTDLLWRGETYREARAWRRRYKGCLPALQDEFLDATFALARRRVRLRRFGLVGVIALLSLLVAAAAVALLLIRDAEQRALAKARQAEEARALADRNKREMEEQRNMADGIMANLLAEEARVSGCQGQLADVREYMEEREREDAMKPGTTTSRPRKTVRRAPRVEPPSDQSDSQPGDQSAIGSRSVTTSAAAVPPPKQTPSANTDSPVTTKPAIEKHERPSAAAEAAVNEQPNPDRKDSAVKKEPEKKEETITEAGNKIREHMTTTL